MCGTRRLSFFVAGLVLAVAGLSIRAMAEVGPTNPEMPGSAPGRGAVIAVLFAGRHTTASAAPGHLTWAGSLLSPTGEVVGTLIHDIVCSTATPPPCLVFDASDTFRFPEGEIISRAKEGVAPDPVHPGFVLAGIHPSGETILSATGAFTGQNGQARMWGHHDGRELPGHATFDDFWLIELR